MPAGKYYIGDLCYVLHDAWDEFCEITIKGNECLDGEFTLKDGRRFATYRTAWGDGEYPVSTGGSVGVDAGLIGCILVDQIRDDSVFDEEHMMSLGVIVEFKHDFETYSRGGVITFGRVSIDTE